MKSRNSPTGSKKKRRGSGTRQYTIRAIPEEVDHALRQESRRQGSSLNSVILEALRRGTGLADVPRVYHDLDFLVGTWVEDPEFDEAMEAQRRIDPEIWT